MQERKSLLYAIDPPLHESGGVSVLAICLIKAFSEKYHVHLLSADNKAELEGLGINSLLASHLQWAPPKGPPRPAFLRYVRQVASEISNRNIDLVHFHSGFFGWGNRIFGFSLPRQLRRHRIPSLWTTHGVFSLLKGYCGPRQPLAFKLALFPAAWFGKFDQLLHTNLEIQVSRADLKTVRRWWFPLRTRCAQFYHSKINPPGNPPRVRKKIILNVGYISFNKRQDLLARAFLEIASDFPEWHLTFAGRDAGDGCQAYISSFLQNSPIGSRVHFLGPVRNPSQLMRDCGIYVHSSDFEGLPLAVQEAMHHGCPIIASDISGHRELLESGAAGLLFSQGDYLDLAAKLKILMSDCTYREKLSAAAMAEVARRGMSLKDMIQTHESLYQSVLEN